MKPSLTRHKAWANAFMLAIAILLFAQQVYLALLRMGFGRHVVKPYYISGWLINYRGGFVRRGDVSRLCGMWTTTAVAFAVFFKPSPLLSRVACAIRGWSWAPPVTIHRTVVCLATLALMFLWGFNRSGFDLVRSFRKSGVMRILAIPEYFK